MQLLTRYGAQGACSRLYVCRKAVCPPAPALAVLGPAEKPLILEPWATF